MLERGRTQGVDAALGVHAYVNETGGAEDAEMLGDLGLAETESTDEVADGAGAKAQEFDDVKAVRLGEGAERSDHGGIEYASVRIFLSRNILRKEYNNKFRLIG